MAEHNVSVANTLAVLLGEKKYATIRDIHHESGRYRLDL